MCTVAAAAASIPSIRNLGTGLQGEKESACEKRICSRFKRAMSIMAGDAVDAVMKPMKTLTIAQNAESPLMTRALSI